jgi:uncharacterized protein (TIGR02118 family)
MYRMTVLHPHPADPAAFRAHYEATHLLLVAKLPGLLSSHHAFDLGSPGETVPYFCIWEGTFDSRAAMTDAMQSPAGQAVTADAATLGTGAVVLRYEVMGGSDAA